MNFTDQKPRIATRRDCEASWGGAKGGKRFRCYLCGRKFKPGDVWRWVYSKGKYRNFLVCEECDGDDVLQRWHELNERWYELNERCWWASK